MHQAALNYLSKYKDVFADTRDRVEAVDLGGRETNGTARHLWPNARWTVVDAAEGPGVDVVMDARHYQHDRAVDLVLFAEVAEHFPQWRTIIHHARSMLARSNPGLLLVTAAGPGRAVHGVNHDDPLQPGWYRNVDPWELEEAFLLARFDEYAVEHNAVDHDVYGWAMVNA